MQERLWNVSKCCHLWCNLPLPICNHFTPHPAQSPPLDATTPSYHCGRGRVQLRTIPSATSQLHQILQLIHECLQPCIPFPVWVLFALPLRNCLSKKKKPSSGKTYHTITSPYCTAYQNTLLTNPKITLHLSMLSDFVRDLLLLR